MTDNNTGIDTGDSCIRCGKAVGYSCVCEDYQLVELWKDKADALSAENERLRAENILMEQSIDEKEIESGLSTTGGFWRWWAAEARKVAAKNTTLSAELTATREALAEASGALQMITDPDAIQSSTVLNAYAACIEAEAKARRLLMPPAPTGHEARRGV